LDAACDDEEDAPVLAPWSRRERVCLRRGFAELAVSDPEQNSEDGLHAARRREGEYKVDMLAREYAPFMPHGDELGRLSALVEFVVQMQLFRIEQLSYSGWSRL